MQSVLKIHAGRPKRGYIDLLEPGQCQGNNNSQSQTQMFSAEPTDHLITWC